MVVRVGWLPEASMQAFERVGIQKISSCIMRPVSSERLTRVYHARQRPFTMVLGGPGRGPVMTINSLIRLEVFLWVAAKC